MNMIKDSGINKEMMHENTWKFHKYCQAIINPQYFIDMVKVCQTTKVLDKIVYRDKPQPAASAPVLPRKQENMDPHTY